MTADQIHQLLLHPEGLTQDTLPVLRELTEQYPAFEAGWMLYLKNLKALKNASFEQELLNGAIRIHDRRNLYIFLNKEKVRENRVATEESEGFGIPDIIVPSEYLLENLGENTPEADVEAAEEARKSDRRQTLIEKFLEAQPRIPAIKAEEAPGPVESHKTAEAEPDELVTETLATIYAQQGYYKKAIQIFEKLSLKYPEKSTYFAAQIEKTKSLMNN
jgi:tetratricopeptide (TPR) repeat protein